MLRIYDDVLSIIRQVRPLLEKLKSRCPSLADQGERALGQVPLRIAEGSYSRGKNRAVHYHGGAGSMHEVIAVFDTAAAFGHVHELDPALRDHMKRCVAVLFKNAR
jgi:hypothetical protein